MKSREEFVEEIKEIRAMLASGAEAKCSCPNIYCEFHGDCYNCIRIHRYYKDHLPKCLQPMLKDKLDGLTRMVEEKTETIPGSPKDYWDFLNDVAPPEQGE